MQLPIFIGLRYAGARRRSQLVSFLSAISVTGLIVGVALLLAVLSIMNGFDRELRERILGLVPQAAVFERGGMTNWQAVVDTLLTDERVAAAAPFVQVDGLASHGTATAPVLLYGIEPEVERSVSKITDYISEASLKKLQANSSYVLLGKEVAKKLHLNAGDKFMVVVPDATGSTKAPHIEYFELLEVIHSRTELDNSLALTSLQQAARLAGRGDAVTGVRLKLKDIFEAPEVVYENLIKLGVGFYGTNWKRTHYNLYHAIHMSKNLVGLLMSLIVAIAAFNIISTLIMVVVDKQGDIAILRTLGASTRTIMLIFIVQGSFIGLVGTIIGIAVGCGLALVAQDILQLLQFLFAVEFLKSDVYPLTYLPTEIKIADISQVGLTALALSFLATLYPAYRASKVQPADALRYE